MTITVDTKKTVLCGETAVYKTGRFINETSAFTGFDIFLDKLAGSVILSGVKQGTQSGANVPCCKLTVSGESFYFVSGSAVLMFCTGALIGKKDLVFYKYSGKEKFVRRGDSRFAELLKRESFEVEAVLVEEAIASSDFLKLYRLSGSDGVNLPRLNETQQRIVLTEDSNMLVQGVAGSGKTNLCIDKIIYSAGRGYAGRILYSTFSRGLLADTQSKVIEFCAKLKNLVADLETNNVVFCGGSHVKAVENKLGICLDISDDKILVRLRSIADFLDKKVDYCLIEDIYRKQLSGGNSVGDNDTAGENYFVRDYIGGIKNHQLTGRLSRISYLSYEVIYKEIYGMISGCCDKDEPTKTLSQPEYTARRSESFSAAECDIIYSLAKDYFAHLQKSGLTDNNLMCREMLQNISSLPKYSLTILDEVQDMTEVNLVFFRSISLKMFCVGDALQMINASYFSFAYLKRLLYEKDISSTAELVNNYRNNKKIAAIAENLGRLNAKCFGVHSFVLRSESIESNESSEAVYFGGNNFLDALNRQPFNNYTIVVASRKEKERLRSSLKKQEILTVAEIKGLERDTVILHNVLSTNAAQWRTFERMSVNRKAANENSVYRYYFNLLYVGVSRAKTRLYVSESESIKTFAEFFKGNFEVVSEQDALRGLLAAVDKTEIEQDELLERVKTFIASGQYENARFAAGGILPEAAKLRELNRIDINERFISRGLYRDAGVRFLQLAMYSDALGQFKLAGDETLIRLTEICLGAENGDGAAPGLEVLSAFAELSDNETARKVIAELVADDLERMKAIIKTTGDGFKKIKHSTKEA